MRIDHDEKITRRLKELSKKHARNPSPTPGGSAGVKNNAERGKQIMLQVPTGKNKHENQI